jgi:hypothetical protein
MSAKPKSKAGLTSAGNKSAPKSHHLDNRAEELATSSYVAGLHDDDMLTTKQVAHWLGTSVQFLEQGRAQGYGPEFINLNEKIIRYRKITVVRFLQARTFKRVSDYLDSKGAK